MDKTALEKAIEEMERAYEINKSTDHVYGVRDGAKPIAAWPTAPCKIVFLDFDGVLNHEAADGTASRRDKFIPSCVMALNTILLATKAFIVISSSWRNSWSLRENTSFLEKSGVINGRVVGKTPSFEKERGMEIHSWLCSVPFAVESFVILDDRDDMAMHRSKLVQTNPSSGLTHLLAKKAIEILSNSARI